MTTAQQHEDVVDVLTTDHHEVLDTVKAIRASTDPARRRDLADTIIAELVRHSVAEEMFVYPPIRAHVPDGNAKVEHDTAEHKELERAMKDLEGVAGDDPVFEDVLDRMERILLDHVRDEETDQFPQLRASIDRDKLVHAADQVRTAKRIAPTRPHPNSPNNALFHATLGPGVGFVDRLRDKLSGRNQEG